MANCPKGCASVLALEQFYHGYTVTAADYNIGVVLHQNCVFTVVNLPTVAKEFRLFIVLCITSIYL